MAGGPRDWSLHPTGTKMMRVGTQLYADHAALYTPPHNVRTQVLGPFISKCIELLRDKSPFQVDPSLKLVIRRDNTFMGAWYQSSKIMDINVSAAYSFRKVAETVFHELIHCDQYLVGRLESLYDPKTKKTYKRWRGGEWRVYDPDFKTLEGVAEYQNYPWEVEANEGAAELVSMFWTEHLLPLAKARMHMRHGLSLV